MIPRRIIGANARFVAPVGWEPGRDGDCCDLWARHNDDGTVESAWEPTPEELAALNAGGSVVLRILGGQPPVMVYAEVPAQEAEDATA